MSEESGTIQTIKGEFMGLSGKSKGILGSGALVFIIVCALCVNLFFSCAYTPKAYVTANLKDAQTSNLQYLDELYNNPKHSNSRKKIRSDACIKNMYLNYEAAKKHLGKDEKEFFAQIKEWEKKFKALE